MLIPLHANLSNFDFFFLCGYLTVWENVLGEKTVETQKQTQNNNAGKDWVVGAGLIASVLREK